MAKYKKDNHKRKTLLVIVLIVSFAAVGYFAYQRATSKNYIVPVEKTTSTAPSAQETFNNGGNRTVTPTSINEGNAVVSDTQGQQSTSTDKSQWSTSKTGEITVYTPSKNKILAKGDLLSGESLVSVVYYRIIDEVSGMIAQGQISVVNGKFSGTVSFNTSATTGRLDIYSADASGKEFGNVEIPIRFK